MNILQLVPELEVGGVERGTVDLAKALVKKGHKAVIISNGGELATSLWGSGIVHYKLPVHEKNPLTILQMVRRVRKIIKEEAIDVVHARSRVPGWIGFLATRKNGIPFVTTAHGFYRNHPASRVMGWGKFVIVASLAIARHIHEDFGVPTQRIRLIPRGVDLAQFPFRGEKLPYLSSDNPVKEPTIGMISRITPLKGHGHFLRAAASVIRQWPHLRIWIIGDVPKGKEAYRDGLVRLVRRLGLSNHVEFLGERQDIAELLSQMDLLVMATTTPEAFGRVVVEAQAIGVPVVATRVGGLVDIIESEKTGILVPPQDPIAMAEAISRALGDSSRTLARIKAARRRVEEDYSLEKMVERTLEVYREAKDHRRILVIKMSSMGDVLLATPSLRAIRQAYPSAWISVLAGSESLSILQRCPYINELISYDRRRRHKGVSGIFRLGQELRRNAFDSVIDFQNNRTSHLAGALSLASQRYGYKNGKWSFFLTHACRAWRKPIPAVQHQFQLLSFMGLSPRDETLEIWPSLEVEKKIKEWLRNSWLSEKQRLVAISPFTSSRWLSKRWALEKFSELMDLLAKEGIRSVLVGAPGEEGMAQELMKKTAANPLNAVGKTSFPELAVLLRQCQVLVTGDSAPLHVAAAVGIPFVALFGPTDPKRHLPPHKEGSALYKNLTCQPCYKTRCPLIHHNCLETVTVEEVYQEIKKWIVKKPTLELLEKS